MRVAFGVLLVTVMMVTPAWAQPETGVSVGLVGDIARYNGPAGGARFPGDPSRDGEALGFSLRLDRSLGSRWGVELEYARGGEIASEESRVVPLFPELTTSLTELSSSSPSSITLLPIESRTTYQSRLSTVSTLAWVRQSAGDRTSLVYSAGLGFGIWQTESTFAYIGLPSQNTLPASTIEYTSYSIHPVVGMDARISMTEHAALVPGVQ